jgi:hypothetical protein
MLVEGGGMLQLYFLSVSVNALAGLMLASDWLAARFESIGALAGLFASRRGRLAIGLASLFVGFITLFLPARGPILLGDLAPSAAGLAMGLVLVFEVLRQETLFQTETAESPDKAGRVPSGYRVTLGMIGLVTALVHFFLPERLIL